MEHKEVNKKLAKRIKKYGIRPVPKPIIRDKKKIGRNDKCPCGSKKKYKRCCLNMITGLNKELTNSK